MFSKIINEFEKKQLKNNLYKIKVGDFITVEINVFDKLRKNKIQYFSGIIISIKNKRICSSIIVRKYSNGEGIEQLFFIHSNNIKNIIINNSNRVRKSKLFFIKKNKFNKLIKTNKKYINI
ncbi:50S ribosomal protein L19 [endosymbiont of Pachyrhynchus infernalis]|uniref:50S ribosomal protein L19 n=1 Tax=endosymbiont of Pachyrhynchus infernalis TaxID=1971488 RepID=UPI000DC6DA14|nr:50S ribosomal protein L19 [endosymbiont of Pachyrhynchus infernalis]BBA84880.1 50S ribosomal protein L19 [endosymbiont of Pachyrhynchus infernalis]